MIRSWKNLGKSSTWRSIAGKIMELNGRSAKLDTWIRGCPVLGHRSWQDRTYATVCGTNTCCTICIHSVLHACLYIYYVCMYVCLSVCMYVCMYVHYVCTLCMYIMYICMYVRMYVCIYVYMYIYIQCMYMSNINIIYICYNIIFIYII